MGAANRYTTTEFLASVRRKAHIPPSQTAFQDADLLALGDDEIEIAVLPQIVSTREGFYRTYQDLQLNSTNVYDIPYRAIGGALANVQIVNGTQIYQVDRSEENEQFSTVSSPTGYWSCKIQGNQVVILPVITMGVVRLHYLQAPNLMVPVSAAAQVTAINMTTKVLTFAAMPTTFTVASSFDCVADQPHFGWRFIDMVPTALDATTVTFSSLPVDAYGNSLIKVGDWLALAGQTPIPQVPREFSPLVVQRTVLKYYEAQNYKDKAALAEKKLEQMETALFKLINPRISGSPKRIVPDSNVIGGYRRWRAWRAT